MRPFTMDRLDEQAAKRPEGYKDEVLRRAKRMADGRLVLSRAAFNAIAEKFQQRPAPTALQIKSFARASVFGQYVSPEVVEERNAICDGCEYQRVDDKGKYCGRCGCSLSREDKSIRNLAAYVENLPKWGCKHPKRSEGKGWQR